MPAMGMGRESYGGMPSPYTDGEMKAQRRKRDLLKATKAVTDRAVAPASLIPHWGPGLCHFTLWRKVIISPLHFPACFLEGS